MGFDFLYELADVAQHRVANHIGVLPQPLEEFDLLELGHLVNLRLSGAVNKHICILEEPLEDVAELLTLLHMEHVLITQLLKHFLVFCGHCGNSFVI